MPRPRKIPHRDDKPRPGYAILDGPWCPKCGHLLFGNSTYHTYDCDVCLLVYDYVEIFGGKANE